MKYSNNKKCFTYLNASLVIILTMAVVLLALSGSTLAATDSVTRLAGEDRWETSANVALDAYPDGAVNVIIARGDNKGQWADGLAGGYLAGVLDAPILLTATDELDKTVIAAIETLDPDNAYILGGPMAVSAGVEAQLEAMVPNVVRIEGDDREETAALIAQEGTISDNTAFIAQGRAPADSMVAGPAAFAKSYPILLVNKDSVPDVTANAITSLGIKNIIIVGGEAVVSAGVETELGDIQNVEHVFRLAGEDREETSVAFANGLFPGSYDFSIVNGRNGLADAVGAAVFGNPILYVNSLPEVVESYLEFRAAPFSHFHIFGGDAVVAGNLENTLQEIADQADDPPNIHIYPLDNKIWADDWTYESDIKVHVRGTGEVDVDYIDWDETEDSFTLWVDYDFEAGDEVTVSSDDDPAATHIIKFLHIDNVDYDADKVYGKAAEGESVQVIILNDEGVEETYRIIENIGPDEEWTADFSVPDGEKEAHDIQYSDMVLAVVYDEIYNQTKVDWHNPHLLVHRNDNFIMGFNWPIGEEVTITFAGTDYEVAVGDHDIWWLGNSGFFFKKEGVAFEEGDEVTVTCGDITRTHVVKDIQVTDVNTDTNTIKGTATANSEVAVELVWDEGWLWLETEADGDGKWLVDFTGEYDIGSDDEGAVFEYDDEGNATEIHWSADDPG